MRIEIPAREEAWEKLAAGLLRAHLGMADASLADLSSALARLGVEQRIPNLSQKLSRGRFSAVFLLQVLIGLGVEELDLRIRPARDEAKQGAESGGASIAATDQANTGTDA